MLFTEYIVCRTTCVVACSRLWSVESTDLLVNEIMRIMRIRNHPSLCALARPSKIRMQVLAICRDFLGNHPADRQQMPHALLPLIVNRALTVGVQQDDSSSFTTDDRNKFKYEILILLIRYDLWTELYCDKISSIRSLLARAWPSPMN